MVLVPTGLAGLIVIAMVGKGFGHVFLDEVNRCLSESLEPQEVFWLGDELVTCFVMFMLELPLDGGFAEVVPRI